MITDIVRNKTVSVLITIIHTSLQVIAKKEKNCSLIYYLKARDYKISDCFIDSQHVSVYIRELKEG